MKISRIETFLKDDIPVCRVHTDTGESGTGQCSTYRGGVTVKVLHEMIAPLVLARHPLGIDSIVDHVMDRTMKFPGTFVCRALAGVDTALWDLKGRLLGQPVAGLLGGPLRDPVPMYASSMSRRISPEDEAARMKDLIEEQGFGAVKLRVGTGPHAPMGSDGDMWAGRTEGVVRAVREALGDEVRINVDANSSYTAHRAIRVGRMLERYGVFHFEEPCPYPDIESTRRVTQALDVYVAGGEQDNSLAQWRRMIDMRALDIVQPDILYIGGVCRARRVAIMADQHGLACTPHAANRAMVQLFTLHFASAMPNCLYEQEWTIESTDWSDGLLERPLRIEDGAVSLPGGPGWGIEVSEEWLSDARHRESSL
ncbi:MAG: mandelate racemase/muconate lactonizing enzyme family protein [Candidatus Brocadiaceae bacterium]|jgi:L-alanine-DL-glutamate epimerase-like enolase superfamily enzyme